MNRKFEPVEVEVIRFEASDAITCSSDLPIDTPDPDE